MEQTDKPAAPVTRRPRTRWTPLVLMAICAVCFNVCPYNAARKQGPEFLRIGWGMYHKSGKACDVRYYDGPVDQAPTYVERWTLLGAETPEDLAPADARVKRNGLHGHHRRVCAAAAAQAGRAVELYAKVRCGDRPRWDGWEVVEDGTRDVCVPKKPRRNKAKAKAKPKAKPKPVPVPAKRGT